MKKILSRKQKVDYKSLAEKHLIIIQIMNEWIALKQKNVNLQDYFQKNNYNSIAIYGMSYLGERLYDELKNSSITVEYVMDRDLKKSNQIFNIVSPESEKLNKVDVVVVTAITNFDEIKLQLKEKLDCPIISIENILYEI